MRTISFAVPILLIAGCNQQDDHLEVVRAGGSVLVDGRPADGVVLQLLPDASSDAATAGLKPGAVSDGDGKFQIMTYALGDGAPVGKYKVIAFWPPNNEESALSLQPASDLPSSGKPPNSAKGPPDRFSGKYFDALTSEIEIEITDDTSGGNNSFSINLESR